MKNMYTIRDLKGCYSDPYCEMNDAMAIRGFKWLLETNEIMKANKADYQLFRFGVWNPDTGLVDILNSPVYLCGGNDE